MKTSHDGLGISDAEWARFIDHVNATLTNMVGDVEFLAITNGTEVVVLHEQISDVRLWHRHRSGWIAACDRME